MLSCCWCTTNTSYISENLESFLEQERQQDFKCSIFCQASSDLVTCFDCIRVFHKMTSRENYHGNHKTLYQLAVQRIIKHLNKWISSKGMEHHPILLQEVFQYPQFLLHPKVNKAVVSCLKLFYINSHNYHPICTNIQPGLYLLVIHPDEQVREWARDKVKSLGALEWAECEDLKVIINWLTAVITKNLFDSPPPLLSPGSLCYNGMDDVCLPHHLVSYQFQYEFWMGTSILMSVLPKAFIRSLFNSSSASGHQDFLDKIINSLHLGDQKNMLWPYMSILTILLDRFNSEFWHFTSKSPKELLQKILSQNLLLVMLKEWAESDNEMLKQVKRHSRPMKQPDHQSHIFAWLQSFLLSVVEFGPVTEVIISWMMRFIRNTIIQSVSFKPSFKSGMMLYNDGVIHSSSISPSDLLALLSLEGLCDKAFVSFIRMIEVLITKQAYSILLKEKIKWLPILSLVCNLLITKRCESLWALQSVQAVQEVICLIFNNEVGKKSPSFSNIFRHFNPKFKHDHQGTLYFLTTQTLEHEIINVLEHLLYQQDIIGPFLELPTSMKCAHLNSVHEGPISPSSTSNGFEESSTNENVILVSSEDDSQPLLSDSTLKKKKKRRKLWRNNSDDGVGKPDSTNWCDSRNISLTLEDPSVVSLWSDHLQHDDDDDNDSIISMEIVDLQSQAISVSSDEECNAVAMLAKEKTEKDCRVDTPTSTGKTKLTHKRLARKRIASEFSDSDYEEEEEISLPFINDYLFTAPNDINLNQKESVMENTSSEPDNLIVSIPLKFMLKSNLPKIETKSSSTIRSIPESNSSTIKSALPPIRLTPESNSSMIKSALPPIRSTPESNSSTIKSALPTIRSTPESNSSMIKSVLPQIRSTPESYSSTINSALPTVRSTPESNSSMIKSALPTTTSTAESYSSTINSALPTIRSTPESNSSMIKSVLPTTKSTAESYSSTINSALPKSTAEELDSSTITTTTGLSSIKSNLPMIKSMLSTTKSMLSTYSRTTTSLPIIKSMLFSSKSMLSTNKSNSPTIKSTAGSSFYMTKPSLFTTEARLSTRTEAERPVDPRIERPVDPRIRNRSRLSTLPEETTEIGSECVVRENGQVIQSFDSFQEGDVHEYSQNELIKRMLDCLTSDMLPSEQRHLTSQSVNESKVKQHLTPHDLSHDLPQESPDLPQESHDLPQESRDLPQESHDIPQESHDLPQESRDLPQESHDFAQDLPQRSSDLLQQELHESSQTLPSITPFEHEEPCAWPDSQSVEREQLPDYHAMDYKKKFPEVVNFKQKKHRTAHCDSEQIKQMRQLKFSAKDKEVLKKNCISKHKK